MVGPIINAGGIVLGAVSGALLGERVPVNLRERMPMIFACAAMGIGIAMIVKAKFLPVVMIALLLGSILGELAHLERGVEKVAGIVCRNIEQLIKPPPNAPPQAEYMDQFIAILVLFSVSGIGVFGAMNEGMTGDATLLIIKAFLDMLTAGIFAIALGFPVVTLAIPQFLVQAVLFFAAASILPLTTPDMLADFTSVGGLLTFATGFRICGLLPIPIANLLPSLLLVMPISALWAQLVVTP